MAETAPRKVGQYILAETLGKGGYSWVKKGIDEKTGHPVALKFMTRAEKSWEKEQAEQVRTEIKSLIRINHANVMKLYAYNLNCKYPEKTGQELNTILLVLEYCPGGELFDILYYTQQLDAVTARTYFIQMMHGLKACHDAGIVHRDLKPQNLLMDANYQLKLTDFGLSFLGKDETSADNIVMKTSYVGTRGYQAPELLKRENYKKACDIFSAGVVLFILLTGYPPFEQATKLDKWYKPLTDKPSNPAKFWKQHEGCGVDKVCQDLISGMLAYKPQNRLKIEQILKHPWCAGKGSKVHTSSELIKVLKEKHRETRRRRRADKKKQSEMNNSIKRRKRDVSVVVGRVELQKLSKYLQTRGEDVEGKQKASEALTEVTRLLESMPKDSDAPPAPTTDQNYDGPWALPFHQNLSRPRVVNHTDHKETLMTFYTKKEHLAKCYQRATTAFYVATDYNAAVKPHPDDPWTITTTVKQAETSNRSTDIVIQLQIVEINGTGQCAFDFARHKGSPLQFHKIWQNIEAALLLTFDTDAGGESLLYDDLEITPEIERRLAAIEAERLPVEEFKQMEGEMKDAEEEMKEEEEKEEPSSVKVQEVAPGAEAQ